jgi:hypothetical protein
MFPVPVDLIKVSENSSYSDRSCFSRQSLAIRINLDTSILKEDCPIPKSLYACSLMKSKASSIKVTLFCSLLELFHFVRKLSFISVIMTLRALAIHTIFFLDIYNPLPFDYLDIGQKIYII